MGASSRVLEIVLRAKNEATKVLQGAQGDIDKFSKTGMAGAAVTAFGVGAALALNQAANSAIAYGSAVVTVQRLTGGTAEEASKFTAILSRNGVEGKAQAAIVKTLSSAIAGHSKELAKAGIATQDASGKNRTASAVLADLAEYYSKSTDKAGAVALASKVLGKNYAALLPTLANGKAGIAAVTEAAQRNGKILGQDSVDQIKKYNAQLKANTEAEEGLKIQAGLALLPIKTLVIDIIGKAIGYFTNLSPAMKNTIMAFAILGTGAALIVGPLLMLIGFLPAIGAGLGMISAAFASEGIAAALAWLATLGPVALVIAAIALVVGAVFLIVKNWGTIGPFFQKMWAGVVKFFTGFWDNVKGFASKWGPELLAVIFPFLGVPLVIAKHWDVIGPFFAKMWAGVVTYFRGFWSSVKAFVAKWGVEILTVLVPFVGIPLLIKKHWDTIGPAIAKVWASVKNSVKGGIDGTIAFVKQLPQRMFDALKGLAAMIGKPIQQALDILNKLNPFMRHSPSLVDNVMAGTARIALAYAGLSGMRIAAPSIGGLSAGRVNFAAVGGVSRTVNSQQAIHLYLDGRELNRGVARVSGQSDRSGAR